MPWGFRRNGMKAILETLQQWFFSVGVLTNGDIVNHFMQRDEFSTKVVMVCSLNQLLIS